MKNLKKLIILGAIVLSVCSTSLASAVSYVGPKSAEIIVFIPGYDHDNGFMEAAYRGYERIKKDISRNVSYVSNISATSNAKVLTSELEKVAQQSPKLIIAQGGQNDGPVMTISTKYPHIQFVIIQGHVKSTNVSSYIVNQEQSAFLAGALAGYITKTNKVGHISGAWPKPGLQARAAFYEGLRYVKPNAEFYTTFTGNLDSQFINKKAAESQLKANVDVIYTMLNGGRQGVTDAITQNGQALEIGNVTDWTKQSPIFIGSAVADSSVAIYNAAKDFKKGILKGNSMNIIGLEKEDVVRLAINKNVDPKIVEDINIIKDQLLKGNIKIRATYNGFEYNTDMNLFVSQSYKEKPPQLKK